MQLSKTLLLILLVLLLASCSSTRRVLIKKKDYQGWILTDWESYSNKKEFQQILGENYHLYAGYGLKKIVRQQLVGPQQQRMNIELFFTKRAAGAHGLYKRYQTFTQIPVGQAGSESPGYVAFYRGDCFVKVMSAGKLRENNQELREAAQLIDAKLK